MFLLLLMRYAEKRHEVQSFLICSESSSGGGDFSPVTGAEILNVCLPTFVITLFPEPFQSGLQ